MKHLALAISLALALPLSFATAARADGDAAQPTGQPPATVQVVNGRRVYVLRDTRIRGERQAPYQFNLNGRSAPEYRGEEHGEHFAHEVVSAVRHNPF